MVGLTGAGKSTLVKLICGLYQPTDGRIEIDGTDLRNMDLAAWRRCLSGAFQDFFMFEGSAHMLGAVDVGHIANTDRLLDRVLEHERSLERAPDRHRRHAARSIFLEVSTVDLDPTSVGW